MRHPSPKREEPAVKNFKAGWIMAPTGKGSNWVEIVTFD